MMCQRYADAIRVFSHILIFASRARQLTQRTAQHQLDFLARRADKMYALLTICLALSPARIDENVHSALKEKYGETLNRLQRGISTTDEADEEEILGLYVDLFRHAAPKFINPNAVGLDVENTDQHTLTVIPDRAGHQISMFLNNAVRPTLHIPLMRSFLKLYTTLGIERLADLMQLKGVDEEELRSLILLFKRTTRQIKWTGEGSLLNGDRVAVADLDFCLKDVCFWFSWCFRLILV